MGYVRPLPISYLVCGLCERPYMQHITKKHPECPQCKSRRIKTLSRNKAKKIYKEWSKINISFSTESKSNENVSNGQTKI